MKNINYLLIPLSLMGMSVAHSEEDLFGNEFIWEKSYGVVVRSETISPEVSQSIGKIFIAKDRIERFDYSDSPRLLYMTDALTNFAISEYDKNIKKLKIEDRVDYLWTVIWNLELGEATYIQIEEIISRDCPDLFIKKLDAVLKHEKNESKLSLAKVFKSHITYLAKTDRSNKK